MQGLPGYGSDLLVSYSVQKTFLQTFLLRNSMLYAFRDNQLTFPGSIHSEHSDKAPGLLFHGLSVFHGHIHFSS